MDACTERRAEDGRQEPVVDDVVKQNSNNNVG